MEVALLATESGLVLFYSLPCLFFSRIRENLDVLRTKIFPLTTQHLHRLHASNIRRLMQDRHDVRVCYTQVRHHYMVYVLNISSLAKVLLAISASVYRIIALSVSVVPVMSGMGTKTP